MTRLSLLSFGLVALVALSGCSVVDAQRYPTPHRGGTVYRPADHRPADYRADRYNVERSAEWRRVRRDVREYVRFLDRQLRLDRRQERRINETLENRTYRLLRQHRGRYAREVYPFPRRFRHDRNADRRVERFWRDADRRVERVLDREQRREHRYLTETRGRSNRGRSPRRYRDDDRRYDDRYYREDRRDRDDDDRRGRRGRDRDRD